MINKMRLKFIAITMGALILLLISILVATNTVMWRNNERTIEELMHSVVVSDGEVIRRDLVSQDGQPDKPLPPHEQQNLIEVISVKLDKNNEVLEMQNDEFDSEDDVVEMVDAVLIRDKNDGKIGNYKYMIADKDYGKIVVFANQSIQDELLSQLRNISYIIGIISFAVLSIIVYFLSKLVTKPIEVAFEKQKRFISDSGHELKTPLSILSANADMMEMELGKNEWLTQIKQQSHRMNKLIHELLTLAKTEDMNKNTQFMEFNLGDTITNTVLPLEVIAFDKGKQIECNIAEDIIYNGNEKRIIEMIEALMDNAIKYSKDKSTIFVNLYKKGSKKIIEVSNKGGNIEDSEKDKLFEKFYRIDDSRARETGSYGLGLSIVKNIVDIHKGKIEIDTKSSEYIIFRVILN